MPSSGIRLGQKSNLGKFIYEQPFSLRWHIQILQDIQYIDKRFIGLKWKVYLTE